MKSYHKLQILDELEIRRKRIKEIDKLRGALGDKLTSLRFYPDKKQTVIFCFNSAEDNVYRALETSAQVPVPCARMVQYLEEAIDELNAEVIQVANEVEQILGGYCDERD